ncbi:MAG: DUF1573 domain-containing protein [Chloroflexi bacterium]|nr:DUF1573 domain-containing protein [Chloroflexota bacterium]
MKNLFVLTLVALSVLIALAGCTGGSTASKPAAPKPAAKAPFGPIPTPTPPIMAKPVSIAPAPEVKPSPTGGPRIAFNDQVVDFGKVPVGNVVAYGFEFKNVGDQPLEIRSAIVRAVEGC